MNVGEIQLEIRASATNPSRGNDLDVEIWIIENPGVTMFDLFLYFDSSRFEQRNPTVTVAYTDMLAPGINNPVRINGFVTPQFTNSTYTGLLATAHFRVLGGASPGNVDFHLLGEVDSIQGFDLVPVTPIGTLSQTITVGFGTVPQTGIPNITWAMYALFTLLGISVVSGVFYLQGKLRRNHV